MRFNGKMEVMFAAYDYVRLRNTYAGIRNNLVYIRISIRVLRPTQDRMNFFSFSKARFSKRLKRFCSTLLLWCRHRRCLVFRSGMRVTDLPPEKIKKMDEQVEVSQRKYSRRRVGSYNLASLIAKV